MDFAPRGGNARRVRSGAVASGVVRTRKQISVFSDGEVIGVKRQQAVRRTTRTQGASRTRAAQASRMRTAQTARGGRVGAQGIARTSRAQGATRANAQARRRAQLLAKRQAQARRQAQMQQQAQMRAEAQRQAAQEFSPVQAQGFAQVRMEDFSQAQPEPPKRPLGPEDIALDTAFDLLEMQPIAEESGLSTEEMVVLEDLTEKTNEDLMQQARENGVEEIGSIEDLQSTTKEPLVSRFISFEVEKRPLSGGPATGVDGAGIPGAGEFAEAAEFAGVAGTSGAAEAAGAFGTSDASGASGVSGAAGQSEEQVGSAWQAGREKEIENVAKRNEAEREAPKKKLTAPWKREKSDTKKARGASSGRASGKRTSGGRASGGRARVSSGYGKGNTVALIIASALLATLGSTLAIVLYLAFFQK